MKIQEFLDKIELSEYEKNLCLKVYKDLEKTEKQWELELKNKVSFSKKNSIENNFSISNNKEEEVVEEINPNDSKEEKIEKLKNKIKNKKNNK